MINEDWEDPRYESADFARGYSEAKQEEFHRVTDIAMEREAKLINEMVEWQNIAEYLANELATKVTDIPGVTPKSIIDGARFAVKQVAQVND